MDYSGGVRWGAKLARASTPKTDELKVMLSTGAKKAKEDTVRACPLRKPNSHLFLDYGKSSLVVCKSAATDLNLRLPPVQIGEIKTRSSEILFINTQ